MGILSMYVNSSEPDAQDHFMKPLATSFILSFILVMSGCNTVKGVGQDLQKVGEKIEDVAKKK